MRVRPNLAANAALLIMVGLILLACNGHPTQDIAASISETQSQQEQTTLLSGQPAKRIGGYSIYLLDANQSPLADDHWLDCTLTSSDAGDELLVSSLTPPPDDVYIYLTYPGEIRQLAAINLDDSLNSDYLLFSLPGHIESVVPIGLARYGDARGSAISPGPMLQVKFVPGKEQTYKTSSLVNLDNKSESLLSVVGSQPGGFIDLAWDERNIGDYNNNGEVEIADITPIALHFGETLAESSSPAELLLVDGDENGEINLADLTPIARNFLRTIDGYTLYHAVGNSPDEAQFSALGVPSVTRSETWDNSTTEARRSRLQYSYHHEVAPGTHHYFVRAYAADGSPGTQGLPSNTVAQVIVSGNLPPQWDDVEGITAVIGTPGGIRVVFGAAIDPEGGEVDYILRYTEGFSPMFSPGMIETPIPPEVVSGTAPFSFTVEDLSAGQRYNFLLRAYDPDGNGTTNSSTTSTTVPALGVSTDPWAYVRGDIAGTSSKPAFLQPDTYERDWLYGLGLDAESPENQPVISKDGWIAVAHNDGTIRRLSLDDGSLQSIHPAATGMGAFLPTLDGYTLVVGTETGLAIYDMATIDPPTAIDLEHEISAAPLLMGDYVFAVASDGWVFAVLLESGEVAWSVDHGPSSGFSLAPVSDGQALFAAGDDGTVYKIDLLSGEFIDSVATGSTPIGNSLAIDTVRGFIYLGTEDHLLVELNLDSIEITGSWARLDGSSMFIEPCLILHADPPLAVVSYFPFAPLEMPGHVVAINLETGDKLWDIPNHFPMGYIFHNSASSNRIFSLALGSFHAFDFSGTLRQWKYFSNGVALSSIAMAGDKLVFVGEKGLTVLAPDESDLAPEWQMHEGIESLEVGDASILARWTHALDDHGAPAYYTLFVSESGPPNFSEPFGSTTLIKDIPDAHQFSSGTGPNEYLLDELENGKRYWIGVRAHDAPWDESPNIDTNTKWLAATPPWQRWNYISGLDWVSDEVFTMRGIMGGDGLPHLVYTDTTQGYLGHAIWISWDPEWLWERTNLSQNFASAIDLDWDTDLLIGVADIPTGKVGVIERTGSDNWTKELISPSISFPNPQVSFQYGTESALAYTEHISGVFPPTLEGHYYISTTVDGVWQEPVPLDEANYSGRDLDLVLDPADNASPWVAFQRGHGYAPDFFTCETGELMYAKPDGEGGYDLELIDAGENAPDSDCGKRVRQVVESDGTIHIAYLDLNASPDFPLGQLKYAYNDGTGWEIETVHSFGLSFQTMGLQHTWGEISLALYSDGTPLIGFLGRISASRNQDIPHTERAYLWVREADNQWRGELLTDEEYTFPRDREPCVLLVDGEDIIHLFFVATTDDWEPEPRNLAHLWRPSL